MFPYLRFNLISLLELQPKQSKGMLFKVIRGPMCFAANGSCWIVTQRYT